MGTFELGSDENEEGSDEGSDGGNADDGNGDMGAYVHGIVDDVNNGHQMHHNMGGMEDHAFNEENLTNGQDNRGHPVDNRPLWTSEGSSSRGEGSSSRGEGSSSIGEGSSSRVPQDYSNFMIDPGFSGDDLRERINLREPSPINGFSRLPSTSLLNGTQESSVNNRPLLRVPSPISRGRTSVAARTSNTTQRPPIARKSNTTERYLYTYFLIYPNMYI
jgi:hypothetical protein